MVKGRLRRIERAAEDHYTVVRCPECGVEVRGEGDVALRVLAISWSDEAGQHREPDPVVDTILRHPHPELQAALFKDFSGVSDHA